MFTRTITGTISKYDMNDLKPGEYAIFTVDSDTGAVDNGRALSGRLTVSSIRCYSTAAYLAIRFDDATGAIMAQTEALSGDSTIHGETFDVLAPAGDLMQAAPSTLYLCVEGTGSTNKVNFREGCTISLEIYYSMPPELVPYTDPVITAGVTKIKAAHMSELRVNINLQRDGMGIVPYSFTPIRAGYTSLAGWMTHVAEMRAAIDETGVYHEAWIPISVNCPTAAVIEQLRRVVEAML